MAAFDPQTYATPLDEAGKALIARHAAWWQRKGALAQIGPAAPLGDLWLPLADGTLATQDVDLTPEMLDYDRLAGEPLAPGPLERVGDLFAERAPYTRVPWVEAILGCPIRATIQGGSMRTHSFIRDWDEWKNRPIRRHEGWFDALKHLTELLVMRSSGRYAVPHTLMRGPCDLAEAVLGPELMCLSMYDHPRELTAFLEEATAMFIEVLHAQIERTPRIEGGYINPFGVWAAGVPVRTQCDATAFLSARQYAECFRPYDARNGQAADWSVIHLHSCSLHTVGPLLEVERPHAIQVTLEVGPNVPSMREMIPIFKRILASKPVLVDGPMTREEIALVMDELPHEGLYVRGWMGVEAARGAKKE